MRLSTGHLIEDIVGSLFPRVCPLCRRRLRDPGEGFCAPCFASFLLIRPPVCARCGAPFARDGAPCPPLCPGCLLQAGPTPASGFPEVRSVALHDGPLRRAILAWKYGGRLTLSSSLGWMLQRGYTTHFSAETFDAIVPVPLHRKRLRERGYNQCVLLAAPLAKRLGVPLELESVEKVRDTPPQSGGGRDWRRANLRGAFSVVHPGRFTERSVLILDDVVTTGTTVRTLAEALRAAGARRVCALTLTRSQEHAAGTDTWNPRPPQP